MKTWLRRTLPVVSVGALALVLAACGSSKPAGTGNSRVVAKTRHVTIRESQEVPVVAPTLKLFWELSSVQVRDPSAARRLLEADPRQPAPVLQPLGVDFEGYQKALSEAAGVRAAVLFLPHDADPVAEARRHGLAVDPWPETAPPALLSGPAVDTLILFQPPVAARVASLHGLAGLLLAETRPANRLDPALYQVQPRDWKRSATFEHTRCSAPLDATTFITQLTYDGGATDVQPNELSKESWGPCALSPAGGLKAVKARQPGRAAAGRPVIIASSYLANPYPGPLLARWVAVK
ncbi:MAG: hypothetical protein ACJ759_03250 [Thermoanaerobaculia bacterium]